MGTAVDWWRLLEAWTKEYKDLLEFLVAAGTILGVTVGAVTLVAKLVKGRLRQPIDADPKLSAPPVASRSLSRYSARAVDLLGRDAALARLKSFLMSAGGFAWMQIAGVGGQGKSRLGYELTLWAQDRGWQAGLLCHQPRPACPGRRRGGGRLSSLLLYLRPRRVRPLPDHRYDRGSAPRRG